jgi:hypothetical protein
MRTFPFTPRSVAEVEIGDYWTVGLPGGGLGVLQVRDVKRSGLGARTSFVAGVVDWHGDMPPEPSDLRGCRVLAQGLTRVEVFSQGQARLLGNAPDTVPVDGLTSSFRDLGVGAVTHVWGWKALARRAEQVLQDAR